MPLIEATPATVDEVSVAVYVPSPWSVTAPSEPLVVESVTALPPAARLLPVTSLSCTVIVEVVVPLARIEVGLAAIVEFAAEAGPGVTAMDALVPATAGLIVSVTVTLRAPTVRSV